MLDLFAAAEVEEYRRALYGGAAFKVVPGSPGGGRGIFGGGVEGAEVDYACFVGSVRRGGRGVDQGPGGVRGSGWDEG